MSPKNRINLFKIFKPLNLMKKNFNKDFVNT